MQGYLEKNAENLGDKHFLRLKATLRNFFLWHPNNKTDLNVTGIHFIQSSSSP